MPAKLNRLNWTNNFIVHSQYLYNKKVLEKKIYYIWLLKDARMTDANKMSYVIGCIQCGIIHDAWGEVYTTEKRYNLMLGRLHRFETWMSEVTIIRLNCGKYSGIFNGFCGTNAAANWVIYWCSIHQLINNNLSVSTTAKNYLKLTVWVTLSYSLLKLTGYELLNSPVNHLWPNIQATDCLFMLLFFRVLELRRNPPIQSEAVNRRIG